MIRLAIQGYSLDTAQVQGGREDQQDRYVISVDKYGAMLAVFDGHGGADCAQKAQDVAGDIWQQVSNEEPETALKDWVRDLADITNDFETMGCTLSAVFIPKDGGSAYTAVLGDSPILVRDEWGIIRTAPDHNLRRNEYELTQAVERGGWWRGGYLMADPYGPGLQMGRALGDGWMGPLISKEPDINIFSLGKNPGDFVLIGSDGIFNLGTRSVHEETVRIKREIDDGADANDIALSGDPSDNATVILLRRAV